MLPCSALPGCVGLFVPYLAAPAAERGSASPIMKIPLGSQPAAPIRPRVKICVPRVGCSQTDVFIFDCDGVIWKGDSLIEGVPSVLDRLRQAGKR